MSGMRSVTQCRNQGSPAARNDSAPTWSNNRGRGVTHTVSHQKKPKMRDIPIGIGGDSLKARVSPPWPSPTKPLEQAGIAGGGGGLTRWPRPRCNCGRSDVHEANWLRALEPDHPTHYLHSSERSQKGPFCLARCRIAFAITIQDSRLPLSLAAPCRCSLQGTTESATCSLHLSIVDARLHGTRGHGSGSELKQNIGTTQKMLIM